MDLARIDLNLLLVFEAIWAERSVTKAASRLGLSQPATSDALRRLRLLFQDALFTRVGVAMRPSPRAVALAPGLEAALRQLREALGRQIPFDPASAPASFVIAATDYNAHVLLPPLMTRLRHDAPNLDIHVVGYEKGAIGAMLARGEADVALGVFPDPPADAVKQALFEERFIGVARAGHPALAAGAPDFEAFAALPQALVTVRRGDRTGAIDRALAERGAQRKVALTVPYMMTLPEVLAGSDLVCALPERIARRLDSRLFALFELPLALAPWTVEMLWNPLSRTDQASAWLRRAIQSVAAEMG
jgi:DNA-binding transcriptional LysR family regulator